MNRQSHHKPCRHRLKGQLRKHKSDPVDRPKRIVLVGRVGLGSILTHLKDDNKERPGKTIIATNRLGRVLISNGILGRLIFKPRPGARRRHIRHILTTSDTE